VTISSTTSFPSTQDLLDAALQYAGRGWRVFPLRPNAKTPLIKGGYKAATVAPSVIERWWHKWPMANIGIATGAPSGLVVLDIDGEAGLATLKRLVIDHWPLLKTGTVKTSRGWHLYFNLDIKDHALKCSSGDGLDVRANGGYVVAPPSVHESGFVYRWEDMP